HAPGGMVRGRNEMSFAYGGRSWGNIRPLLGRGGRGPGLQTCGLSEARRSANFRFEILGGLGGVSDLRFWGGLGGLKCVTDDHSVPVFSRLRRGHARPKSSSLRRYE